MPLHHEAGVEQSRPAKIAQFYAVPLRLCVGCGFMAHGYAKLARGLEHFISILGALSVPAPRLMGW